MLLNKRKALSTIRFANELGGLPELFLALFLFSGFIKSRNWLTFVNAIGDPTIIFAGILFTLATIRLLQRPIKIPPDLRWYLLSLLVFYCFTILHYVTITQHVVSTNKLLYLTAHGMGGAIAATTILQTNKSIDRFFIIVLIIGTIGGVDSITSRISQLDLPTSAEDAFGYQWSSRMSFYSTITGLILIQRNYGILVKLGLIAAITVSTMGIVMDGGRQGILALLLCFIYFLLFANQTELKNSNTVRHLKRLGLASIFIIPFVLYVSNTVSPATIDTSSLLPHRLNTFIGYVLESDSKIDNILGIRGAIYAESWEIFKSNPLFGVGFGNYMPNSELTTFRHSHNIILELLCETGIVGTIAFSSIWIPVVTRLTNIGRVKAFSNQTKIATYLIVGLTAMMQVSGDIGINSTIFPLGAIFIISLQTTKEPSSKHPRRAPEPHLAFNIT